MTKSRHGEDCPCVECEHEYLFNLENKRHQMNKGKKTELVINEHDSFLFDNLEDAQAAQALLAKSTYVNSLFVKDKGYESFTDGPPLTTVNTDYNTSRLHLNGEAAQKHLDGMKPI